MLRDLDLHQRVRRIRRRPAARRQLQLGHELLLAHAEPPRRLRRRRLSDLGQPSHDGEQPPQPPARLRAGRALGAGRRPVPPSSVTAATTGSAGSPDAGSANPSSHPTSSSRNDAGSMIVAWSSSPSTHERMAGKPDDPEDQVDRPVVGALHHLVLAHLVDDPARLERVDPNAHVDGILALGLPGLVGHGRLHVDVDVVRHVRAPGVASCHRPLDPVDPEGSHARPFDVPRHQVPVTEAEPEADRRDDPGGATAVGERRRSRGFARPRTARRAPPTAPATR